MKKVLTIAGSDSGGGAGIQTDLKTFAVHGVYGMSAVTSVTAQNTVGVFKIENLSPEIVYEQIKTVWEDIGIDAIKIGMLPTEDIITVVANAIFDFKLKNIVLDPVMISTSGHRLISQNAVTILVDKLLPLADIITPNIMESKAIMDVLTNRELIDSFDLTNNINLEAQLERIGKGISQYSNNYILIKGGHREENATDILVKGNNVKKFFGKKIKTTNTHGTGCTLSSSIAANLALGYSITESVKRGKIFVTKAIENAIAIGKGNGPTNPLYLLKEKEQLQ